MQSRDELEAIYDEHAEAIFRYLLNLLRNEHDTRDVLQDMFIRLADSSRRLEGVRNMRGYLVRMAHNAAIDLIRKRAVRERYRDGDELGPRCFLPAVGDADGKVMQQNIDDALLALPPDQRAVVHLKLWDDMTFADIARALEISPNTAASRYRYGIDKLRELLRPIYEEIQ